MSHAPSPSPTVAWDDADAFLGRLDQLAHASVTARDTLCGELLSGVIAHAAAQWAVAEIRSDAGCERIGESGNAPASLEDQPGTVEVRGTIGSDAILVVRYLPRSTASPRDIHRGRDLVEAACDIVTVFLLRRRYEQLQQTQVAGRSIDRQMARLEAAGSAREAARHATLLIQEVTQWDRISVVHCGPFGCRLVASAGTAQVDRRSPQVKALERAVFAERKGRAAEQEAYLATTRGTGWQTRGLAANTVLVFEHFRPEPPTLPDDDERVERAVDLVVRRMEAESAGVSQPVAAFRTLPPAMKVVAVLAALAVCLLLAALLPWTLTITAQGQLLPDRRTAIFAPADGVVMRHAITNGELIEEGAFLAEVESPELDLVEQRLIGELATLRTELAGVQAGRVQRRAGTRSPGNAVSDSRTEELLKTQIEGVQRQLELIAQQQAELILSAPFTGVIHRMDDTISLQGRPVVLGQYLCDLYRDKGAWSVEVDVAEKEMADVLVADEREQLRIEIATTNDPGRWYDVETYSIDSTARVNAQGAVVVRIRGRISSDTNLDSPRIGAGVIARLSCGQTSLLRVWTRDFVHAIHRQGWF